ncbi:carbohydrate-binding module family 48 protein, partial [Collybiopsis luxurians FD-317 M1]
PHTEPNTVIVAGTFDQWSQSIHLVKGEDGFRGKALVSWNAKILYKFIVDGQWVVNTQEPTETDEAGNVNNVFTTPSKPSDVSQANGNGTVPESQPASDSAAGKPEIEQGTNSRILPQLVSDLVTTIAATDGTSSALNYVASGVGAAIQGVIGVDPINPDQVSRLLSLR